MDDISNDLLSRLRKNMPGTDSNSLKPPMSLKEMYKSEPLLLVAHITLAASAVLGFCSTLTCLFIPPTFCIVVVFLCIIAFVGACGYIWIRDLFPPDKPPEAPFSGVPNDVPWPESRKVLDEFCAEVIKTPGEGEEDATINPAKAALKKHLEDPNADGARLGVFLLNYPNVTPEKICQFFSILMALDEARLMEILMAIAKVKVPGFDTGQYESMGALAMTYENPDVRIAYLDLLGKLNGENLAKVLSQSVWWKGLPANHTMLGMFIVSRELPTNERIKYIGTFAVKLTSTQLWDIKTDDGWPLPWSLLLFGDKEPEGKIVRDTVKSVLLYEKGKFDELMTHRPASFSKASQETHANEEARTTLNTRMEAMRTNMNDYLRSVAEEYGGEYQDVEWTS
ncbi:MAG: hypothetical protein LBB26_00115 [Puniceicoccales bacterium]|jgi:hypothetical protein|nr:hypothetical protein [Puniceicoccales bacterium]